MKYLWVSEYCDSISEVILRCDTAIHQIEEVRAEFECMEIDIEENINHRSWHRGLNSVEKKTFFHFPDIIMKGGVMPTICYFFGILIQMYWRDHEPPSFSCCLCREHRDY